MPKKRKKVFKGYLLAEDMRNLDPNNEDFIKYWNHIKDYLLILGDIENDSIKFLNREFIKLAEKFEGIKLKITIETLHGEEKKSNGLPDLNEEYEGFEKFKKTVFSIFKIS